MCLVQMQFKKNIFSPRLNSQMQMADVRANCFLTYMLM